MNDRPKITLSIDGVSVTVPQGTLIIEAAEQAGIYIPRFCYHKLLKPYAGCRMCLVNIPKGSDRDPRPFPAPQAACILTVQEGMVVETKTEAIQDVRKGILEFTLINHPLDCPICDKGGECDLQDLAYLHGREDSRFHDEKIFNRHTELSSVLVQDFNRCIQCKRCVRWTEEVADDDRLIFRRRGAETQVATFNNEPFRSRFAGMTIDLCPVGALTSKVFRFKARSWELGSHESACTECALGCSFNAQHRNERIMRFLSKEDPDVNGPFFCDRGRFAHDYLEHPDRLVRPIVRRDGKFVPISWDDAAWMLVENFQRVVKDNEPRALAACIDPSETLESLWTFRHLFRNALGTPRIEHTPAPLGFDPDDFPAVHGRLARVEDILTSKNLVLWESDPFDEAPVLGLRMKLAWEKREIDGVSITPTQSYLGRKGFDERIIPPHRMRTVLAGVAKSLADRAGSIPEGTEKLIRSAEQSAANLEPSERGTVDAIVERLLADGATLVIGTQPLRNRNSEIAALILIVQLREAVTGSRLSILPMFRAANSLAAMLLGIRTQIAKGPEGPAPSGFTGESALTWPEEIENGKIKAMFVVGDGLIELIGSSGLDKLASLDFLVVVTDFMNPLAARADLVIPRLAPWEQSGTFITLDGRIRRVDPIVPHPTGAWSLDQLLCEVSEHLGKGILSGTDELHTQIADACPAFRPLLNKESDRLEPPTRTEFRSGGPDGTFESVAAPGGENFGAIITEAIFRHNSRGKHSEHVEALPEEFCCGMNSEDASRLGLRPGDQIRISVESGGLVARVKFINVPKGYILLPSGYLDHPLADLGLLQNPHVRLQAEKMTVYAS